MPAFHVRFKGMLTGQERDRLNAAGFRLLGSESSLVTGSVETGIVRTGRRIYTVIAEANSPEEALARVRNAIEPDTANFVNWEVEVG